CSVAGTPDRIDDLESRLKAKGVDCKRLRIAYAAHSNESEAIVPSFVEAVSKVELRRPSIPYISNVTGTWIQPSQVVDPAYWGAHLRRTVRFGDGMREILKR